MQVSPNCIQKVAGHQYASQCKVKRTSSCAAIWLASDHELPLIGNDEAVRSATLSVDGSSVLTASADSTAKPCDIGTGDCKLAPRSRRHVFFGNVLS